MRHPCFERECALEKKRPIASPSDMAHDSRLKPLVKTNPHKKIRHITETNLRIQPVSKTEPKSHSELISKTCDKRHMTQLFFRKKIRGGNRLRDSYPFISGTFFSSLSNSITKYAHTLFRLHVVIICIC